MPNNYYRITMGKKISVLLLFCSLFLIQFSFRKASPGLTIQTRLVAKDFTGPVAMDCPRDHSKRLFICEQTGKIKIIKNGKVLEKPFLDVSSKLDKVSAGYSEKGLLGLAFHPNYKVNGRFFIYYSAPESRAGYDHKSVIAEYKVSANADMANPVPQYIIMEIPQPESNHNGGQLAFGPDGFLYIGLGDGGGAGDIHGVKGNGQNLGTWLGKILRIDINSKRPYAVPPGNPFVNNKKVKPEIWAYGLRNPWRFSFDRKTGRLFCADVGQNKWEEIDIITKGKNYGWRTMEAGHCYNPETNCNRQGLELPIAEYGHDKGISVTGGYVYRGKTMPKALGKYIFADWKGVLFYLSEMQGKWTMSNLIIAEKNSQDMGVNINSFGEDEDGELYILGQKSTGTFLANGLVYKLEAGL